MADVVCPVVCQPVWPACWLDTPDRSSSSSTRVVQDVWDVYRDELGVVPEQFDVHCAQYFVNSSLAPVVLFRRRLKSVADVLKGIRSRGFCQSRWNALLGSWVAVCRHGPCGPISSLHPWDKWIPPDLPASTGGFLIPLRC